MTETGSNTASASALTINQKGGTGSIAIGNTSVNVAHGLGSVPTRWSVSPYVDSMGVDIFVSAVDATNLTVAMDFIQASLVNFSWEVGK